MYNIYMNAKIVWKEKRKHFSVFSFSVDINKYYRLTSRILQDQNFLFLELFNATLLLWCQMKLTVPI